MQLTKQQIQRLSHAEYLKLRAELEAKPSKHATPGAEVYQLDRIWHGSHQEVRRQEASEARAREHDYRRSLPQPTEDDKKLASLKADLPRWKALGRDTAPLDNLIAGIESKQAVEVKSAKFQNSEEFKLLSDSMKGHIERANDVEKHELQIRWDAFLEHQDEKRMIREVSPFVMARMKRDSDSYFTAEEQNMKLQAEAAQSAADSLERNRDRELEAVQRYGKLLPSEGGAK
jgi:hypothetical protein